MQCGNVTRFLEENIAQIGYIQISQARDFDSGEICVNEEMFEKKNEKSQNSFILIYFLLKF